MNTAIFIFILTTIFFILFTLFNYKRKTKITPKIWPFYVKKPLTIPEQILFFKLQKALPEHMILAQVQLSRFLGVKKGNNYQSFMNRINRLSADFVICTKDSKIIAIIELDDSSHDHPSRKATDEKKNKAIESAGIKMIRWTINSIPDSDTIKSNVCTS